VHKRPPLKRQPPRNAPKSDRMKFLGPSKKLYRDLSHGNYSVSNVSRLR
jgi:hypothetical protein